MKIISEYQVYKELKLMRRIDSTAQLIFEEQMARLFGKAFLHCSEEVVHENMREFFLETADRVAMELDRQAVVDVIYVRELVKIAMQKAEDQFVMDLYEDDTLSFEPLQ